MNKRQRKKAQKKLDQLMAGYGTFSTFPDFETVAGPEQMADMLSRMQALVDKYKNKKIEKLSDITNVDSLTMGRVSIHRLFEDMSVYKEPDLQGNAPKTLMGAINIIENNIVPEDCMVVKTRDKSYWCHIPTQRVREFPTFSIDDLMPMDFERIK